MVAFDPADQIALSCDPPLDARLAVRLTRDAIVDWFDQTILRFHPLQVGWDLHRLLGADALDLYAAMVSEDQLDTPAEIEADWRSFDRPFDPTLDLLLIDQFARSENDGFESESEDVANALVSLRLDYYTRRAGLLEVALPLPSGAPMPLPANWSAPNPTAIALPPPDRIRPRRIDAATLDGKPIPERQWLIPQLVPAGNVTLLYGDGGTGKSLLALMAAVSVVALGHFFGRPVQRGPVEFVSAEDSTEELHRRVADIARATDLPISALAGLRLTSLADEDAILATPEDGRGGTLVSTALYAELDTILSESRPTLLVLDTLADIYGGNEVVRAQVRTFIGMLRRLALKHGTTVLVLAHPSVAGMEKGTSGSTGWSNSVRSRLYFKRVEDSGGMETDEDARVLQIGKSNYGRVGLEIPMRWRNGVFVPLAATEGDPIATAARADRVFLDLLSRYENQDRQVSVSPGHNYAPTLFADEARAQGVNKRALKEAMERLLDSGRIHVDKVGPPSRQTKRLVVSTRNSAASAEFTRPSDAVHSPFTHPSHTHPYNP